MTMQFRLSDHFANPRFPLTVYHDVRDTDLFLHHHEFGELVFVSQGHGRHLLEEGDYPIEAGDVFYIPEGLSHGYAGIRHMEIYNILFVPDRMPLDRDSLARLPGYRLLFELEPASRRHHAFKAHLRLPAADVSLVQILIKRLADETTKRRAGYETMATGLFLELVAVLARAYEHRPNTASSHLLAVDSALHHIHAHLHEELGIAAIARMAKMSVRTFHRAFQAATGQSPRHYILGLRIAKAKEHLRRPGARITQAAYDVGFQDSNYFSRLFREHTGKSPREWAKATRAESVPPGPPAAPAPTARQRAAPGRGASRQPA